MKNNIYSKKWIDLLIQMLGIALPWCFFVLFPYGNRLFHLDHIIVAYTCAGVVQILSCVANRMYLPMMYRSKGRQWFEVSVVLVTGIVLISLFMKTLILALMLLLYVSPVLAVVYVGVTIAEIVKLRNSRVEI